MFFTNLTRGNEIGANCYLLTLGGSRIILDAGMDPKSVGFSALPALEHLEEDSIDAIVVTHAHLDHAGALPVLARRHPSAEIFLTEPTGDLASAMLHNSVNVMKSQRTELGVTEYPLFSHREIEGLERTWNHPRTRRPFPIGKECDGIECEFFDAGHVVGSVGVMLRAGGKSIFYTGDVHFEDQTLSRAADFPSGEEEIHTAIIETTRGAEERPAAYTREGEIRRFACAIQATLERGGSVLVPLFALGKTQEVLTIIDRLKRDERILNVPVYIGGLSAKMTTVYDKHAANSHRHHGDFRILEHMDLVLSSSRKRGGRRRRSEIPFSPGTIYALSSGMMTANTLSNNFAKNILPDPVNSLLFVGYAAPDSPGGRILATSPSETISLNEQDPPLPLACQVEKFDFSGHATREEMRAFLQRTRPSRIFLVHGDKPAISWFERNLGEDLPASHLTIPPPGEAVPMGGNGGSRP